MKILALEPFYIDSHKDFIDNLINHSVHKFVLYTMPGRFWKWRNFGSGIHFKKSVNFNDDYDLIFASDFLNLPDFIALNRKWISNKPIILYMHENQINYPELKSGNLDRAYPLMNISSCLASDWILFNSEYHRNSFLESLPTFIKAMPDYRPNYIIKEIENKSSVLPLGISIKNLNPNSQKEKNLILWNHRWEHDKNPSLFINTLIELKKEGYKFKIAILGKSYKQIPEIFEKAKKILKDEIIEFGYIKDTNKYKDILNKSSIIISTAFHDFFGISVAEAIYSGSRPILPNRLNYPYFIAENLKSKCLYNSEKNFKTLLIEALEDQWNQTNRQTLTKKITEFSWEKIIDKYDSFFSKYR